MNKDTQHHTGNLRKCRRMDMPGTWFVTKCLIPRTPALTRNEVASVLFDALVHRVESKKMTLGAFVVMPDHWHAVFAVEGLSSFMQGLDAWVGLHTAEMLRLAGSSWQDTFYDTEIRSMRQFLHVCSYIEFNPVRKGLCSAPEEWPWSSAYEEGRKLVTRPWPWDFARDHHR